jgi:GTP cyclohydrolase I
MYARRLQVQERLTNQVADAIEQVVEAEGVMVVFDGEHMCAALRGIKKKGMNMRTTAMRGSFATNPELRQEFRELIQ